MFYKMEKKSVILIKNSALKFTIQNIENTILDNALDSQINLPHGCKSGACGSCEAELVEGEIKTKSGVFVKKNNAMLVVRAPNILHYQKSKKPERRCLASCITNVHLLRFQ